MSPVVSPVLKITSVVPVETLLSIHHLRSHTLDSFALSPVLTQVNPFSQCNLLAGEAPNIFSSTSLMIPSTSTQTTSSNEEEIKRNA